MNRFATLALIALLANSQLIFSCATKSQQRQQQSAKKPKSTSKKVVMKPVAGGLVTTPIHPLNTEVDYSAFIFRLSNSTSEYTEKDRITWNSYLVAPIAGSLHEAAIVIGAIRESLTPTAKAIATNNEIMANAQKQNAASSNSNVIAVDDTPVQQSINLESRCREKGVDLVSALSKSPFLKSQSVYGMAWEAALKDNNSQVFIDNIHAVIKTEYQNWESFAQRLGLLEVTSTKPVAAATETPSTSDEFKSEDLKSPQTSEPNLPLSAAENAEASKILSNAQALAGKEDFEKAIIEARKIRKGAEVQSSAQEHIVNWANKAVQNLRRQAANQYRSSSSTNDPVGKKAYLSKAKSHLEDAITKFPESTNLDTVKENLDIIEKELSKLP